MNKSDVLILGNGPAGVSAALYTARAGLVTTIIGRDGGALTKSEKIANYYGFAEPVSGEALLQSGIEQAQHAGARVFGGEVLEIRYEECFVVKTIDEEYRAMAVVIATGANRAAPRIKGFSDFEGRGISYCAVCDGFFYRGKDVAVMGCCEYALHEASDLLPLASSVTLVTNGIEAIKDFPPEIRIIQTKIDSLEGSDALERVVFTDGQSLEVSGLFVAVGVAGSSDLARKIGAQTEGQKIVVDENMGTNIPGLFAAGDCTGGMLQIAKAVHEGAVAGMEAVKFVRRLKRN